MSIRFTVLLLIAFCSELLGAHYAFQGVDNAVAKESTPSAATGLDPRELVKAAWSAAETVHDYNKAIQLTQQANAIWKKNGTKPPEYAESLTLLSLAKLADDYEGSGNDNVEAVYSQWRAQTADLLTAAIDVCLGDPAGKPEVLALALELQSLQTSDKEAGKKLRNRAADIRGKLVTEILPAPALAEISGDALATRTDRLQPPTLLKKVEPVYSEAGREARITGVVHFNLIVEDNGMPSSASLMDGLGFGLDEEAAKAVKQWRFHPGMVDGKAVRVRVKVEVTFRLI